MKYILFKRTYKGYGYMEILFGKTNIGYKQIAQWHPYRTNGWTDVLHNLETNRLTKGAMIMRMKRVVSYQIVPLSQDEADEILQEVFVNSL